MHTLTIFTQNFNVVLAKVIVHSIVCYIWQKIRKLEILMELLLLFLRFSLKTLTVFLINFCNAKSMVTDLTKYHQISFMLT